MKTALQANKRYECGDNFFKLDMTFSAALGVPMIAKNVDHLLEHYFLQPCALPLPCVVRVKTDGSGFQRGHMACVSPVEIRMAVLRAVAGALDDPEKVRTWKRHLLSCHFVYVTLDSDEDTWKYARQLREDIAQNYTTLRLSALQALYEFINFKNHRDRVHGHEDAKVLAALYTKGVRMANTTEPVTQSFVESAITIDKRMLSQERIAATLLKAEKDFGGNTPFDAVTKLLAISKAGTPERIAWVVESIADAWEHGLLSEKIGLRTLQSGVDTYGKKSLVAFLCHKYELKEHIPHFLRQHTDWCSHESSHVHDLFLKALSSHTEYRTFCGSAMKPRDLTWRARWPFSAEVAFRAFEAAHLFLSMMWPELLGRLYAKG